MLKKFFFRVFSAFFVSAAAAAAPKVVNILFDDEN
jgi:hypothetical protein